MVSAGPFLLVDRGDRADDHHGKTRPAVWNVPRPPPCALEGAWAGKSCTDRTSRDARRKGKSMRQYLAALTLAGILFGLPAASFSATEVGNGAPRHHTRTTTARHHTRHHTRRHRRHHTRHHTRRPAMRHHRTTKTAPANPANQ